MARHTHSDSKRDDILRAAIRLFARHGVDGTTVRDIAGEAGVTDAAIYKHFEGKEVVALAVFVRYSDLYTRVIDGAANRPGAFRQRLDRLVAEMVALHDEDPFGLMLLGQRHHTYARIPADHRRPVAALTEFVADGVKSGEIPPQDPKLSAALLTGALVRLAVFSDLGFVPTRLAEVLPEIQSRLRGMFGLH